MTLLAMAGIYLVLDVNSPLQGQHLNRYEPWTTYNENYMTHVFKIITEFAPYNNTLAFFAGNEIINDKLSATTSPVYVKAVIRDIKHFMQAKVSRQIPIGYSAADDLSYRTSLADYLECFESDPMESIDFYGVNTYQWCGEQTFQSSGYDVLVKDYATYSKPILFSEYGCNKVLPRKFKEVQVIYSDLMTEVFSGGLVYEFAQEPNNYGLVDYDEEGNVHLLADYYSFKIQMDLVKEVKIPKALVLKQQETTPTKKDELPKSKSKGRKQCKTKYLNLDISKGVPKTIVKDITKVFKESKKGSYVDLQQKEMFSIYKIFDPDGSIAMNEPKIKIVSQPAKNTNVKYANSCM